MDESSTLPQAGLESMHLELQALAARVERLEGENRALRDALVGSGDAKGSRDRQSPISPARVPVSRRQLIRRAGAAVMGIGMASAAATFVRSETAAATDGQPIVIGAQQEGTVTTRLSNVTSDDTVFKAVNGGSGTGLSGESSTGVGAGGYSPGGVGVAGIGDRGGAFIGSRAAINLAPSPHASHPHKGAKGDIVLDRSARPWLCRGGTHWTQVA